MNKDILKNRRTKVFTLMLAVAGIISLNILMQSCSKDVEQPLDEAILNSSELEEYIIAGADFQQSLANFEKELNKIDFSTLEVTYEAEWEKIVHLPIVALGSTGIEKKVQVFNEKKEALHKKFPKFVFFSEETGKRYFEYSIKNSVNVKGGFLKLGIDISRPLLKSGNESYYKYFNSECNVLSFLASWQNNPNYVEIYILQHADGTWSTYWNSSNTVGACVLPYNVVNGQLFASGGNNSPVVQIGHTHRNSSTPTRPDDYYLPSGINYSINQFIYYQYGFYYY